MYLSRDVISLARSGPSILQASTVHSIVDTQYRMDDNTFDVVIHGTGLTESIVAAALAKAGVKIAHIDENPYYGGAEASLSLDELIQWADKKASTDDPKFSSVMHSPGSLPQSRQYSICLSPSVISSTGPIITSLISSGVSKYGGFRLLERHGVYHQSGVIKNVPGTKEDVFKSKDMSLIDKRRLMRFLMFAVGEFEGQKEIEGQENQPFGDFLRTTFSLKDEVITAIVYSLAFCSSLSDLTIPALHRIRQYLRSAGRYGPSPFLVGHYGGIGDIAQGFCRAAAVSGGVYILGHHITSIVRSNAQEMPSVMPRYSISLDEFPGSLNCNVIISSTTNIPSHLKSDVKHLPPSTFDDTHNSLSIARCIAVINYPIYFPSTTLVDVEEPGTSSEALGDAPHPPPTPVYQPLDTGVLIFPPSTVTGGSTTMAATVLITGEGSMSTPKGKWILYITLPLPMQLPLSDPLSSQQLLQPYLDAVLALSNPSGAPPSSHSLSTEATSQISPPQALFTMFYIQHPDPNTNSTSSLPLSRSSAEVSDRKTYVVPPSLPPTAPLPDTPDIAATHAENVFWEVIKLLHISDQQSSAGSKFQASQIDSFWPPLDPDGASGEEE